MSTGRHTMIVLLWLMMLSSSSSAATLDVLTQGQVMNSSQTIVSNGGVFELGFFSFKLTNSTTDQKRFYLGVWYKQATYPSNHTIIWVGNRDQPIITNSSCFLTINNDGNIVIYERGVSIPITSIAAPTTNVTATLLDSGNFVLRQNKNDGTTSTASSMLWQSFDYPTHTSLPGVKIGYNTKTGKTWKLTSWKSPDDPSPGKYSLLIDPERTAQFLVLNGTQPLWTSGSWNGHYFKFIPEMAWSERIYTFTYISNGSEDYFDVKVLNSNSILTRYVMDISGKIQQFAWVESSQSWVKYWEQPKQQCDVYGYCGSNAICDKGHHPYCKCLEGFQPSNLRDWNGGNWSGGCSRRSALQCGDQDGFLPMKNMSLPLDPKVLQLQSVDDCESSCLGICACNAYAHSNNQCLVWYSSLYNVRQADYNGEDLFLKLPSTEIKIYEESNNKNSRSSNHSRNRALSLGLALPMLALVLILGTTVYCWRKRKSIQREKTNNADLDLMSFDFTTKTKPTTRESSDTTKIESGVIWDVELPFFSFSSICSATNNFCNANKIGQGGFGPVYKGTLQNGHEVAIKRLSARSCQGLEELKNETTLIAKLQHRNLVKLLGCCIEGEEKILIYEYMANKSLDLIIFDPRSQVKLLWERRVNVIEGVAQGLLYLHQYSRLRIIHRDLKASNILLDDQLNPKISDFGMARIFGDNRTQANTNRIVGTYGYMSPEYAMEGLFSIKSDVYSFGVLLLEIISGRKNSSTFPSIDSSSSNLIGHVWDFWQNERELELIDPILGNSSSFASSPTKYIQVALLCVQEKPSDRPTMSEVIAMLSSEFAMLPSPKQPAFSFGKGMDESSSSSGIPYSINDVTVSLTAR
ncbi:hypothetical protein Syun_022997 [Stephania yunnanensis]|uniref:Receptor-like serine/threonine-protein kinase n=1 Tax=Stephania yunnanensis TaxID=152371 RepID=A0AAP0F849_9MAGN